MSRIFLFLLCSDTGSEKRLKLQEHHCFAVLDDHVCLLDCIALDLQEMDVFAAERLPCYSTDSGPKAESADLLFPSYSVRRIGDNLLKDRCRLQLKVERNLDKYGSAFFII